MVLTPDLEKATFSGDVEIDVTVERPTDSITLNAAELELTFAELNDGDPDRGYALSPTTIDLDPDEERAVLGFAEPLGPGPGHAASGLHRHSQRQAARLLPVHLHR